jgi:hypothetical protein
MLLRVGNPGDLSDLGIVAGDGYLVVSARTIGEISGRILSGWCNRGSRSRRRLILGVPPVR